MRDPGPPTARSRARAERREQLRATSAPYLRPDFALTAIAPLVGSDTSRTTPSIQVVRAKSTGRLTLQYRFDDGCVAYAKAYTDDLGASSARVMQQLWQAGFDGGPFAIPEPLVFYADENLLVMRDAGGEPLSELITRATTAQARAPVRLAAAWLAVFHGAAIEGAAIECASERSKILKLGDMLGKAAAANPTEAGRLLDLFQQLRMRAPDDGTREQRTLTHGQYTPANVFIADGRATIIDLDRVCWSDPAKDVALFLHRLAARHFHQTGVAGAADPLEQEFLDAYAERAGALPDNLPYYIALYALKALSKIVKKLPPGHVDRDAIECFYLQRFARHCGETQPAASPRPARSARTDSDPVLAAIHRTMPALASTEAVIVQDTGTGRRTLRFTVDGERDVYAKVYSDGLGAHAYSVLTRCWKDGFGDRSPFRVPKPLAFLAAENVMLMSSVNGVALRDACLGLGTLAPEAGARAAAAWLAALHRSAIRVGDAEPEWDSLKLFRVVVRLIKAAATQPADRDLLLDAAHALRRHLQTVPDRRPLVQTHGRYHHDHVFVAADGVAVIDLDRSRPSDPAKDVAEFLRVLRLHAFRQGRMPVAERATAAFLTEYLGRVPDATVRLRHHWATFLILSLFGSIKKSRGAQDGGRPLIDFELSEIRHLMEIAS